MLTAPLLLPHLDNSFIFPRTLQHYFTFADRIRERFFNVQRWTEMPAGGHFAAMEQPALLAADIQLFVKKIVQA